MTLFSLSHFIQTGLLPPGFNLLLIILGYLIYFFFPRTGKIIGAIGVITLWLFSAPFFAYPFADTLQNPYPVLSENLSDTSPSHKAIVVLGGGDIVEKEYGNKQTISDITRRRLDYAVYLQQKTHLPIIVSGGKLPGAVYSTAELMAQYLINHYKITPVLLETSSLTTAEESQFLAPLLKQHHFTTIYLVTNAWHMPRSVLIFHWAGIATIAAPMGYFVYGPGYAFISFLPNMQALYTTSITLHEYIGLIWYYLYYGLKNKGG